MIDSIKLREVRDVLAKASGGQVRAWQIKEELFKSCGIAYDESTIRGMFIEMGEPLSGRITTSTAKQFVQPTPAPVPIQQKPVSTKINVVKGVGTVIESLKGYIPNPSEFIGYIERAIDKRLALHYDSSRPNNWKYPLTQGKQGTGKTMSHMYYAYKNNLPFFLFSCFEDFKLGKLFGEKTILGGDVLFKEGMLVQAIQGPSVILFDEVNYVSNENSVDFHAMLQNRELFVKDADNGNGKVYRLHDECKVGFAQNPKSAKYIGGNIKPSNFLGRCTFITYPEFSKRDIKSAIATRFPNLVEEDVNKFMEFYFACTDTIEKANIPVDISIRQLNNVIDLYNHGLPLKDALEDGLISIMDAASQPKNKEAFKVIAEGVWKEMMNKNIDNKVGDFSNFLKKWR
jgi:MoxR-like ATPase